MAIVQASTDLQNTPPEGLATVITRFLKQLLIQVNGNLEFHSNLKTSSILTFNFVSANSDIIVRHDLGRLPVGYLIVGSSVAMSVYTGSAPWTFSTLVLRSNVIGIAQIYAI